MLASLILIATIFTLLTILVAGGAPRGHVCDRPYIRGATPTEWPPRCATCGRFMRWPR